MSKQIWIDVTGAFLDGCVVTGAGTAWRVRRSARVWRRPGGEGESLERRRARLSDEVASCLRELGARGGRVHVLWRDEGAVATVVQGPAGVSEREAESAATMSLIESGAADPSAQAVSLRPLGAGADGKVNVLASVFEPGLEREVCEAVEGAGAKIGSLHAGDAAAVVRAIAGARSVAGDDPAAAIVMGEESSAIVVSSGGAVRLARFAAVGVSSLRDALAYAMPKDDSGDEPPSARADRLLWAHGVPRPGGELEPGVASGAALRSMQPALQRIAVELKQSIRFTLDASEQMLARVGVFGPSGRLAGLEALLAEQVECEPVGAAPTSMDGDWVLMSLACGAGAWSGASVREPAVSGGGVGVLVGGAAAAALVVAGVGAMATVRGDGFESEAAALRADLGELRAVSASAPERADAEASRALRARIANEFGTAADFGAAARLLSDAAGGVVIESAGGARGEAGSSIRIRGRAPGATASAARGALQAFVERLDASALTSGIEIGATRLSESSDEDSDGAAYWAGFTATVMLHERRPEEDGR